MEQAQTEAEICLSQYSELGRRLRQVHKPLMRTPEENAMRLVLNDMKGIHDSVNRKPYPIQKEYTLKLASEAANTGAASLMCKVADRRLRLNQPPGQAAVSDGFLSEVLGYIDVICCTEVGANVALDLQTTFCDSMATWLSDSWDGYMTDGAQATEVEKGLSIFFNIIRSGNDIQRLRKQKIINALRKYTGGFPRGSNNCLIALASVTALVEPSTVVELTANRSMLQYLVQRLEQALVNTACHSSDDLGTGCLVKVVTTLAKSRYFRKLLFEEHILPCLAKGLTQTECNKCTQALEAILALSVDEKIHEEVMKHKSLLDALVDICTTTPRRHCEACSEAAKTLIFITFSRGESQTQYSSTDMFYTSTARPRGVAVIINNKFFYPGSVLGAKDLGNRLGTDIDKEKLKTLFKNMNFIPKCHDNLTDQQIKETLTKYALMRHDDYDFFICCVLSHGDLGKVYGNNGVAVEIKDLTRKFQASKCRSLAGKPKLFFFQACQGSDSHRGAGLHRTSQTYTQTDAIAKEATTVSVPNEADFLLGYSTVPGYVSYRNPDEGSWYISTLVDVLGRFYRDTDIQKIMTLVNQEMSKLMENDDGGVLHQMPVHVITLRKQLVFGE